jgi:hypothetical protein
MIDLFGRRRHDRQKRAGKVCAVGAGAVAPGIGEH